MPAGAGDELEVTTGGGEGLVAVIQRPPGPGHSLRVLAPDPARHRSFCRRQNTGRTGLDASVAPSRTTKADGMVAVGLSQIDVVHLNVDLLGNFEINITVPAGTTSGSTAV